MSQTTILFSNNLPVATFAGWGKRLDRFTASISACPRSCPLGLDAQCHYRGRVGRRQGCIRCVLDRLCEVSHGDKVPVPVDRLDELGDELAVLGVDLAL